MQKYKCHKVVEAMKIDEIQYDHEGTIFLIGYASNEEIMVGGPWMKKHQPQVDGYYVRYSDDYSSYSPAKAFEAGYELLDDAPEPEIAA